MEMEAHQKLDLPVDIKCCSEIQLAFRNSDQYPGTVALELARSVDKTAYLLPYGLYLRALFYNRVLFKQAGIAAAPKTMDEFRDDSKKIAALPGKSGYCLRGGPGGLNAWIMFGAAMAGNNVFFTPGGVSTLEDPW